MSIWEGMIQAFETLYVKTIRTKKIIEAISDENSETAKIIRFLQKHNKPICHVELANSLGMDYAALTNAIKQRGQYK